MYEILWPTGDMSLADHMRWWLGPTTIAVATLGVFVAIQHVRFMSRASGSLARRVRDIFIADACIYTVAVVVGLFLFFGLSGPDNWFWPNLFRVLALVLQIGTAWRLYRHYRTLSRGQDS